MLNNNFKILLKVKVTFIDDFWHSQNTSVSRRGWRLWKRWKMCWNPDIFYLSNVIFIVFRGVNDAEIRMHFVSAHCCYISYKIRCANDVYSNIWNHVWLELIIVDRRGPWRRGNLLNTRPGGPRGTHGGRWDGFSRWWNRKPRMCPHFGYIAFPSQLWGRVPPGKELSKMPGAKYCSSCHAKRSSALLVAEIWTHCGWVYCIFGRQKSRLMYSAYAYFLLWYVTSIPHAMGY